MDDRDSLQQAENFTMVTGAEGKLAEEGAKLLVEHVVPTISDYARMIFAGKRLLILGPPRCGKTRLLNYLEYLILEPEKPTPMTIVPQDGPDRTLKLGPTGALKLRMRRPRDVPGEAPLLEIQQIKSYRPHCIVVMLDVTKFFGVPPAESSLEWLQQFCEHLDILLKDNRGVSKKLKAMVIAMNKWDEVQSKDSADDKQNREIAASYVQEILDACFHNSLYSKRGSNSIEILPCVLVKTKLGDVLAKELLQSIGLMLSRA